MQIWLDGGFTPSIQSKLQRVFQEYQPRVIAMNGGGAAANPVRWVGTEGDMGKAQYNGSVWSTYCCNNTTPYGIVTGPCVVAHTTPCSLNTGPYGGGGCAATGLPQDSMCNTWYPAGLDYTLQQEDTWLHLILTLLLSLTLALTPGHVVLCSRHSPAAALGADHRVP